VPDSEVVPRAQLTSKAGAPRYFDRRVPKKVTQKRGAYAQGLLGTGVVAANQPASVVRTVPIPATAPIPTVVHPTPMRPGVTHANRTVVGPDA
jgi:hypothetical protein